MNDNRIVKFLMHVVQHYNHDKYWQMRKEVIDNKSKIPKIIRIWYLFRIKKMDAYNNASMGTFLGSGAQFAEPPVLWHGLNGIIISHYAQIGKGSIICQQVTIGGGWPHQRVVIGDNVFIGAGAKILGPCEIGNNVKIGANAVISKMTIPDNAIVVSEPKVIIRE